jgi:hypothetical protein
MWTGGKRFTMFQIGCKEPAPGTKPKSQDFNGEPNKMEEQV